MLTSIFTGYYILYNNNHINLGVKLFSIENCPKDHEKEEAEFNESIRRFTELNEIPPSYRPYSCNICPYSFYNRHDK